MPSSPPVILQLQHPIPNADVGLDVLGIRAFFQLFPKCRHVYPQGGHVAFPAAAPDLVGQIGVGQHLAHILCEQTQ